VLTRGLKTAELLERLRAAGVPGAPILAIDAVVDAPQTRASGMLVSAPHPRIPDYRSVGLPLLWNGVRPEVRRVPPQLGEHTADVLTSLGYTLDDVRSLRAQGVVQ
jgi:crotonobetainyl-CoA:carnitine CoA-transferase CaiB-like acyl-CoA transferase